MKKKTAPANRSGPGEGSGPGSLLRRRGPVEQRRLPSDRQPVGLRARREPRRLLGCRLAGRPERTGIMPTPPRSSSAPRPGRWVGAVWRRRLRYWVQSISLKCLILLEPNRYAPAVNWRDQGVPLPGNVASNWLHFCRFLTQIHYISIT